MNDLGEIDAIKKFEDALLTLSALEKDKNIDPSVKTRVQAMCQYLRLRIKNYGAYDASQIIAESIGAKPWRARLIRTWSNQFLKNGALPISRRGKHQKIKSLMYDEDIHGLLMEYLWSKKCDVNEIIETTIHVWLRKLGWNYQKLHKDTYLDGHERPDVILAREKFIEKISSLEKLMPTLSEDDITILNEPTLVPGETKHIMVVHDESIFYANDGKKTYWGPNNHIPLRKKGMGLSLHVSDFLTEVEGRLKFEEETACVIMKPGVNHAIKFLDPENMGTLCCPSCPVKTNDFYITDVGDHNI
nr:7196_t:CDS:2 [Entrophospora candida]